MLKTCCCFFKVNVFCVVFCDIMWHREMSCMQMSGRKTSNAAGTDTGSELPLT